MKESPFSSRAVILLIACATALAAVSVLLRVYGGEPVSAERKTAPNTYSISAIGHAGFYDLLRRTDRPVLRSTGNVLSTVGTRGVLIIAEPGPDTADAWRFRLMELPRLLLVLPKWKGTPDKNRPSWISEVEPVPLYAARQPLVIAAGGESSVFRGEQAGQWAVNSIGIDPTLPEAVQLIRSEEMTPIVGGEDGMLLGEIKLKGRHGADGIIWVLSDPDVLSNHGIVKGDNGAFMLAVIDALRSWNNGDPNAPIVFDETAHGFLESRSSPVALPFRFPFVFVTALAFAAAALLVLSGMRRFGAAVAPKPVLDFGKANLIGNSARLLDYSGHHAAVLERYIGMTLSSTAGALRAPRFDDAEAGNAALIAWLDQVGRSRGVSVSCADFLQILRASRTADAEHNIPGLFECAKKIYDWKQEILKEKRNS